MLIMTTVNACQTLYMNLKKSNLLRIRYTTSHPKDMTIDLLEAHTNCKSSCQYFITYSIGSDEILKKMNRKHNLKEYLETINYLREKNPKIEFASDFIIAYPGESDEDFNQTCKLMERIKFINSYSFIYSPRPGTPACDMTNVDSNTAKKRLEVFQKIAKKIKLNYKKHLINKVSKVLFENRVKMIMINILGEMNIKIQ